MEQMVIFIIGRVSGGAGRVMSLLANQIHIKGYNVELLSIYENVRDNKYKEMLSNKINTVSLLDMFERDNFIIKVYYKIVKAFSRISCKALEKMNINLPRLLINLSFDWQYHHHKKALKKYLSGNPNAVVIAFNEYVISTLLLAAKKLPNRIIISERLDPSRHKENRYISYFVTKHYNRANFIVFQTTEAKNYYSKQLKEKSAIIPNPLTPDLPEPYFGERNKKIINFCRLTPQKNLPLLIDAFTMLVKERPEYTLHIYGEGELKDYLEEYIAQKGLSARASLEPFSSNIHEHINDCAMFVSSSDYEGMSNSMLEAMAIGLPTICTDCPAGGAREIIRDHENGILVPIKDVNALYKAMKELIENPELAKKISHNGTQLREELSLEKIAQQWINILR